MPWKKLLVLCRKAFEILFVCEARDLTVRHLQQPIRLNFGNHSEVFGVTNEVAVRPVRGMFEVVFVVYLGCLCTVRWHMQGLARGRSSEERRGNQDGKKKAGMVGAGPENRTVPKIK